MSKTTTNLLIVLGVLTLGFGGYYVYTSLGSGGGASATDTQDLQAMRDRTQVFISHRQTLNSIELDLSLLENTTFRNMENYRLPIREVPIGRPNPFAERGAAASTDGEADQTTIISEQSDTDGI